jgi:hypothetical protein
MPTPPNFVTRVSSSFSDRTLGRQAPQLSREMRNSPRMERQSQKIANKTIT